LHAEEICDLTKIDPWFIHQLEELNAMNRPRAGVTVETASKELLREVKRHGTSDDTWRDIGRRLQRRCVCNALATEFAPVFKRVDTCAAEFDRSRPYMYSTYEDEDESDAQARPKIMILGSGPKSHRAAELSSITVVAMPRSRCPMRIRPAARIMIFGRACASDSSSFVKSKYYVRRERFQSAAQVSTRF